LGLDRQKSEEPDGETPHGTDLGFFGIATLAASALVTMRVVLASRDVAVPALAGHTFADASALAAQRGIFFRRSKKFY